MTISFSKFIILMQKRVQTHVHFQTNTTEPLLRIFCRRTYAEKYTIILQNSFYRSLLTPHL